VADIRLTPARDLASQLSNSEWLTSFPGTEARRHASYPQLSFPFKVQKLVAARIGDGEDPLERWQARWER
jgi:hypothetical protein